RSLVPVALMLLLLGNWLLFPQLAGLGLLLVLGILALPRLLAVLAELLRKPIELPWMMHLRGVAAAGGRQLGQVLLTLTFLPYDAFISVDAIGRTLIRLLVTHKGLLEWQTSGDSELRKRADLPAFCVMMWIAPTVALATALFLATLHSTQLYLALPFLGLWLASPWIAWRISQPITLPAPDLTAAQLQFLGHTARKTWHYFDTFVTATENWLPPDNFQEIPTPVIAARTSPTNMGLALLANLAARDFGYLSLGGLVQRTQKALTTMQGLERYRGHFYNWYETRTRQPLHPLYVSSVDSGNLAAHLLTLSSGLKEQADEKIFTRQIFAGLRDTAGVLKALTGENAALSQFDAALEKTPASLYAAHALLKWATDQSTLIAAALANKKADLKEWGQTLQRNCEEHLQELRFLAPWLGNEDKLSHAPGDLTESLLRLDQAPTLREMAKFEQLLGPLIEAALRNLPTNPAKSWQEDQKYLTELWRSLQEAGEHARQRLLALETLAQQSFQMAAMDFAFLFDPARDLFSIGFNVTESRRDSSYYDLLASEARVCGYVAIAQGQVPQEHWFTLGRLLIASRSDPVLVSWSGSIFEYLMPLLVMHNYENTLLDHTCKAAVKYQIEYGKLRGVPWGISESGYNRTDVNLNYQYRAFGVPGLGLKRGLAEDLVIAPYATAMALMVAPVEACENLQRLAAEGREGDFGFYEAVDYTPSRLPPNETSITVQSFMAHHQGMSLLALVNLLRDQPMQRRFMACPLLKAADLLLQERVPNTAA
ncbi:MAG TPA: glucoamylase family protein, partial [Anaerolineales bacterium]